MGPLSKRNNEKLPCRCRGAFFVPKLKIRNDHGLLRGLRLEEFLEQDLIPCHALVQFVDPVIKASNIGLQVFDLASHSRLEVFDLASRSRL